MDLEEPRFDDGGYRDAGKRLVVDRPPDGWGVWHVLGVVGAGFVAIVVTDMQQRGVPFTWHGLRWWLSLWVDVLGIPR